MKVSIIQTEVRNWLVKDPLCRDSDERLCACIWYNEYTKSSIALLTGSNSVAEFLKAFAAGKFTNAESIRRTRQKLQEADPSLRGASYKARQANTQPIKTQLGYP